MGQERSRIAEQMIISLARCNASKGVKMFLNHACFQPLHGHFLSAPLRRLCDSWGLFVFV